MTVTLQRQRRDAKLKTARRTRFKRLDAVSVLHLGDIENPVPLLALPR